VFGWTNLLYVLLVLIITFAVLYLWARLASISFNLWFQRVNHCIVILTSLTFKKLTLKTLSFLMKVCFVWKQTLLRFGSPLERCYPKRGEF